MNKKLEFFISGMIFALVKKVMIKINKIFKNTILGVIFVLLSATLGFGWDGMSSMEASLLEKIQQARLNPGKALDELNMDVSDFIGCHPDLEQFLDSGLPRLLIDDRLFSAASTHAREMVETKHFSTISVDGSTPIERFQAFQYYPLSADEAKGVLLFRNYLSKDAAVDALYRNLIGNELKCEENNGSIIFNPDFKEIGLSIKAGSLEISGVKLNFYLAVVDLGVDSISFAEKQVGLAANLARISDDIFTEDNLTVEVPPLNFDVDLYTDAVKIVETIIQEIVSPDNIEEIETQTLPVHTSKVWITKDKKTLEEAGIYLLAEILEQEELLPAGERVVLNPDYTHTGIALQTTKANFSQGNTFFIHALAVASVTEETPRELFNLSGVLFVDENENNAYDMGEGYAQGFVVIDDGENQKTLITGSHGEFNIDLTPGKYVIKNGDVQNQIGFIEKEVVVTDQNQFLFFDCERVISNEVVNNEID